MISIADQATWSLLKVLFHKWIGDAKNRKKNPKLVKNLQRCNLLKEGEEFL